MPLPLDELINYPELVNQRAQVLDWDELSSEYELALDDMQAWLRGLNEAQIHFKPAAKVFSIAEVVTHNSFSDEMFWSWVALLAQGRSAEIDPNTLISGDGARNAVTPLELEALNEACRMLARSTIDSLSSAPDLAGTTPHPYFGALNAKGWVYFMALHRSMHRYQCERVIAAPGFPRGVSAQTQPREAYRASDRKTWLKLEAGGQPQRSASRAAGGKQQGAGGKRKSVPASSAKKSAARKKKTATRSK